MAKNKVGRNDPCPCGSGKKYKQCCLLKGDSEKSLPEIFLADAPSMRMNYLLLNMDRGKFMRAYKGLSIDIERSVMCVMPSSPHSNESEKALVVWKDRVEKEIQRLCSKHSKFYWLFMLRRIFPETTEPYDLPTTPYLHRTTFNLAVLKYGKSNQAQEFVAVPSSIDIRQYIFTEEPYGGETVDIDKADAIEIENTDEFREARWPSVIPQQITREDAINIYQIEYLALNYYRITAQLRRLWKGGQMKVHQGRFAGVNLPKEVKGLVNLYDMRSPNYGNLLSRFGSITDIKTVKHKESLDNFTLSVPVPNIEKHEVPLVFPGEEFFDGKVRGPVYFEGNPSNFVPTLVSIRPFYEKMRMFRQPIEEIFGFSPEEFVAFLIAVDRHHQSFWLRNIYSRYEFFQSGYSLMPHREDFQRYLEELYIDAYKHLFGEVTPAQASSSFKGILDWVTYKEEDFAHISLWDRTGVKLFLRVPQGLLLTDHSMILLLLQSIFSELSTRASIDGKVGQLRGNDFENEVHKYLKQNIPNFQPWICHRKLQFFSRLERDIDVSFSVGQTLFVVECKAFSVPPAFDRGEISALQTRKEKLDAALRQADTLCELLCKERKGKNFELPRAITHIVAIAASPFPEYIPKKSDRYFLTTHIPRVCTPNEIAEFVKHFRISAYSSKPFVWKIS